MHILTELSLIFALCLAGEGIAALLPVAFPASVISMLLLMALLLTGVVKERRIQTVSRFLLTTPVVYLAAAWTVQLLMRRSRKEAERHV